MLLNNGMDVIAVAPFQIENSIYVVSKLPSARYIGGILVRYVLLPKTEFQDYVNHVRKETEEILVNEEFSYEVVSVDENGNVVQQDSFEENKNVSPS